MPHRRPQGNPRQQRRCLPGFLRNRPWGTEWRRRKRRNCYQQLQRLLRLLRCCRPERRRRPLHGVHLRRSSQWGWRGQLLSQKRDELLVGAVRQADAVSNSSSSVVLASTTSSSVLSGSSSSVVLPSTSSSLSGSSSSSVPSSSSSVVRSSSSSIVLASSTSSGGSSSVSSSVSSSSSAAATGSYSCPANDQQIITNNGTQYQLRCDSPAVPVTGSGSYFRDPTIRASFNECLQGCTTNAFEVPAGSGTYPICTGTTFTITDTVTGTGTCSYRQQNPLMFDVPSQYFTGLIKVQYFQAPSSSVSSSSVQAQTVTQYQTITSSYPVTYTQPGKSHLSVQCPARLTSI
jgi:hypothetical protein